MPVILSSCYTFLWISKIQNLAVKVYGYTDFHLCYIFSLLNRQEHLSPLIIIGICFYIFFKIFINDLGPFGLLK